MPSRATAAVCLAGCLVAATMLAVLSAKSRAEEAGFAEPFLLNPPAEAAAQPALVARGAVALAPFQPAGVSTRLRRALLQFEALVADEAWDEAIELIETLQAQAGDQLVKVTPLKEDSSTVEKLEEHVRYLPLRSRCQQLLASLPPAGQAAYRDRVGRTAQQRLDDAIDALDENAAAEVTEEFLASDAAIDAALAASELALRRGDTVAARRYLQLLHPLTRDPIGRPAGVSLGMVRPDCPPADLATAWNESSRPKATRSVAQPDNELLPTVLARLALASLREGDSRRAASEHRLLVATAPDAVGRIAGRQQPLASALGALIDEASSAASRSGTELGRLAWAWQKPTPIEPSPANVTQANRLNFAANQPLAMRQFLLRQRQIATAAASVPAGPSLRPVSIETTAFFVDAGVVKRLDLTDGKVEKISLPGVPDQPDAKPKPPIGAVASSRVIRRGPGGFVRIGPNGVVQQVVSPAARRVDPSLSVSGGLVFARVVKAAGRVQQRGRVLVTNETLIGFDPARPTAAAVRVAAPRDPEKPTPAWQFAGPPVVRGERLFVAMATPGPRAKVGVACYSTASGRQRWFTEIGSGSTSLGSAVDSAVRLAGDTVYLATNLGSVAAVEARTGSPRWLALYPRDQAVAGRSRLAAPEPGAGCEVVGDRVLAAPSDATRLFAWDATSGLPLWDAARPEGATVAGIVDTSEASVIVLAGRQVTSFDTLTGVRRVLWPESPNAGLRGRGVATVVGGEVFWPTREALYAIDPVEGGFTRAPIGLSTISNTGANVVATDMGLLICGPERLRLLGDPQNPEPVAALSRLMDGGPLGLAASKTN